MKEQLKKGIHRRIKNPHVVPADSEPDAPTDPNASLEAPDIGGGQRRRRGPRPDPGGGIIPPIGGGGDPSDSSDSSSNEGRDPRRHRRGTTPLENNEWLFPPPPDPPGDGAANQLRDPIIDNKIKLNDLPEWDGSDRKLVNFIFDVNELTEASHHVWLATGQFLPRRFTLKAKDWWQGLDPDERRTYNRSWNTLRLVICQHWMTQEWRAQEKIRCKKITFQSEGHAKESPIGYYFRKLRAIRVSFSGWDEYEIVRDILDNAPESWMTHFNRDIRTLEQLRNAIRAKQHLFRKESELESKVNKLLEEFDKTRKVKNSWSEPANTSAARPFFKKKRVNTNAVEAKPAGFHPDFVKYPFEKRDDIVTKRGKTPEERGARPCCNCGSGKHWDNECPHRQSKKAVRVHLATASADILEALDDYNNAQIDNETEEEREHSENPEDEEASEISGNEEPSD
jgi:hypothetical protein